MIQNVLNTDCYTVAIVLLQYLRKVTIYCVIIYKSNVVFFNKKIKINKEKLIIGDS